MALKIRRAKINDPVPSKPIRWNENQDMVEIDAFKTNQKNAWVVDRVNVTSDRVSLTKMSEIEKRQYVRTFVILSRIDSTQGLEGMPSLAKHCPDPYVAGIYQYEAGMEIVHSASYNKQLATFISTAEESAEIDWVENNEKVQNVVTYLMQTLLDVEKKLNPERYEFFELEEGYDKEGDEWLDEGISRLECHLLQLAYSTILESFLFYLLFYYPLYEANVKQRMTKCAEVIRLILRDGATRYSISA